MPDLSTELIAVQAARMLAHTHLGPSAVHCHPDKIRVHVMAPFTPAVAIETVHAVVRAMDRCDNPGSVETRADMAAAGGYPAEYLASGHYDGIPVEVFCLLTAVEAADLLGATA